MNVVRRITREPAALLGVVTATTGLLILFGVNMSIEQAGGILTFAGALVALLRFIVTPKREVVAQEKPTGEIVAGPASDVVTGAPVAVVPDPRPHVASTWPTT